MLMCENFDCSYYICLLMLGFKMVGVYWFIFMNEFYFMIVIVKYELKIEYCFLCCFDVVNLYLFKYIFLYEFIVYICILNM